MMEPAWCGHCGELLTRVHGTAYVQCCEGKMYWLEVPPLPRDRVVPVLCIEHQGRLFWRYEWRPAIKGMT